MRFVSYQLLLSGRGSPDALVARRVLASHQTLTLHAQFWTDHEAARRTVAVVDESPDGREGIVALREALVEATNRLITFELALPPLERPGRHRLHLEVNGQRISHSIRVLVRRPEQRGERARYEDRGRLAPTPGRPAAATPARARSLGPAGDVARKTDGCLRHIALFPLDRPPVVDGRIHGLWLAVYFTRFPAEQRGPHVFSVLEKQPDGDQQVRAVEYLYVGDDRVTLRLALDPLPVGAHDLAVAIDGREVGTLTVTV
jgi:hypothetical protein